MNPTKHYVASVLAIVGLVAQSNAIAQTIPNAASGAANATSGIAGTADASGSQSGASVLPASYAAPTPAAATKTGLLGLGQPRTFPVFRYLAQRHAHRKARIRSSPLGNILKGLLKPVSKLTGGVVPAEPIPNHVELATPGPRGSAARIKKDQIDAPKRLAALQELGKVDCNWYPEALEQMTLALRHDRSECVRLEAARLLAGSDCCTPQMMFALKTCVEGTNQDGNPCERSEQIRAEAAIALERCLACTGDPVDESTPLHRPEYPSDPSPLPFEVAPEYPPNQQSQNLKTESGSIAKVGYTQLTPETATKKSVEQPTLSLKQMITQSKRALQSYREQQNIENRRSVRSIRDAWRDSK